MLKIALPFIIPTQCRLCLKKNLEIPLYNNKKSKLDVFEILQNVQKNLFKHNTYIGIIKSCKIKWHLSFLICFQ